MSYHVPRSMCDSSIQGKGQSKPSAVKSKQQNHFRFPCLLVKVLADILELHLHNNKRSISRPFDAASRSVWSQASIGFCGKCETMSSK